MQIRGSTERDVIAARGGLGSDLGVRRDCGVVGMRPDAGHVVSAKRPLDLLKCDNAPMFKMSLRAAT
jgi:hypothetical protein